MLERADCAGSGALCRWPSVRSDWRNAASGRRTRLWLGLNSFPP